MPVKRKALRIKNALKSATRRGSGRDALSPVVGEHPIVLVRLQVVGCRNLLPKDRNGFSDPFVVASILNSRYQTPVCKKTLHPTYAAKDATFDFPIYLSLADKLGVLELVVWDKDMLLKKDYLGEVSLPLDDWFSDGRPFSFNDNRPFSLNLVSTREGTEAAGSVQIKLGFITPPNTHSLLEFAEIFNELLKRSRPSLVSGPPTEGVGTIRSHAGGPQEEAVDFEDDGGISSDEEPSDEEDIDQNTPIALSSTPTAATTRIAGTAASLYTIYSPPQQHQHPHIYPSASAPDTPIPGYAEEMATPPTSATKPPVSLAVSPLTPSLLRNRSERSSSPGFSMSRMRFRRSLSSGIVPGGIGSPGTPTDVPPSAAGGIKTPTTPQTPGTSTKRRFRRSWSASAEPCSAPASATSFRKERKKTPYSFNSGNDIIGIVMLEIVSASDLPRLRNMTRTGWDMDPFVVISFGKKVFRTRVIRHTLNPVWDEKLLFHVRRYELGFKIQLTLLDWDKLSSNDYIGDSSLDVSELLVDAVQADPETGLYPCLTESQSQGGNGKEFTLPITTSKEVHWEAKHNPTLTLRARYQPYAALRQQFWRTYLKAYDTDDTSTLSHLEITSMLDSLGSTLRASTVDGFFTRFGKVPHKDELTIEETIICLEDEMGKPQSERRRVDEEAAPDTPSVAMTPLVAISDNKGTEVRLELGELDFSGPRLSEELFSESYGMEHNQRPVTEGLSDVSPSSSPTSSSADESDVPNKGSGHPQGSSETSELDEDFSLSTRPSSTPPVNNDDTPATKAIKSKFPGRRTKKSKPTPVVIEPPHPINPTNPDSFERVINVRSCPLCRRPRLNSKAEVDIITHLAVCASSDWNRVDRIVVGNFVTASQAQRKWYTKMISKVSSGNYKIGANSANIIVQNRITGQLEEEKMQVYVRLGIRLLYKGAKGRMEGGRARRLLKSLSIKQGIKYDSPESVRDIQPFIQFHRLNVDEILDPLDSFKTFNEFFYRKLKPTIRPLEEPDDPYRLVSAADCRFMSFETVNEATRLWIKGREFTVQRLLGNAYKDCADKYVGGSLCIFRLAPQDYHRFHSPVDGVVGNMTYIAGEYYTVNPQAVRTTLDVYGENARKIVPIDSPQFGRVMAVCVGAMMVGSILITVEEGQSIKRGQEFGYFAFGGSTIVVLFEKGKVEWDEDLLINSRASLETLVRVGMGIGHGRNSA